MELKIAILDGNYPNAKYVGLAASWLKWELKRAKIQECIIEIADILLISITSQQGFPILKRVLNKYWNRKAKIILGGGGCMGPAIFENIADYICVGEGKRFIRTLLKEGLEGIKNLPETWIKGEKRNVIPNLDFPWETPPILHPDGCIRVWGSRGCPKKCLYCQTGWERKYQPNPNLELVGKQMEYYNKKGQDVTIVTNDGAENFILKNSGKSATISASYEYLIKNKIDKTIAKQIRIGVEGLSERMRAAIKKPIPNEGLLKLSHKILKEKIGLNWFMIIGLPYETQKDWDEYKYLIRQLKSDNKGMIMMNIHAFIPQPAAPLSVLPLQNEYWENFVEFKNWFFDGKGYTSKVHLTNCATYKGRLKSAMFSMCASESQLRKGWFENNNPNWRVKYLISPAKMRKIALSYKQKMEKL
jgi:radical SAM superfamily enzyme YgiQ (UPF0313 family)